MEHVVIDPDQHDCPFNNGADGAPCGCDWHCDGGMRGYKLWAPLRKHGAVEQTNVVVVPFDAAHELCEVAERLRAEEAKRQEEEEANAVAKGGERRAVAAAADPPKPIWVQYSDSKGGSGWKLESPDYNTAKNRDSLALEAVGCPMHMAVGDVLLFFPGVFHRTQDALNHRVALIAEAT